MSLRDNLLAAGMEPELAGLLDDWSVAQRAEIDADNLVLTDLLTALDAGELAVLDAATAANSGTGKVAILGTDGAITFAGAITEQVVGLTSSGVGAKNGGTVAAG